MSDDRSTYDSRRIDGLVSATAKLEEKSVAAKDDRDDIREFIGAVERRMTKSVESIERGLTALRDEYRKDRAADQEAAAKRAAEREVAERSKLAKAAIGTAWVTGGLGVVGAIVSAVAVIFGGG